MYGGVPPLAVTEAVPSVQVLHVALVAVNAILQLVEVLDPTLPHAVAVQPLASIMVTQYVPAARLFIEAVVAPVPHTYEYGGVPEESGIAVAVPSIALADASVVVTVTLQPGPVLEATVTQPVITQPVDG